MSRIRSIHPGQPTDEAFVSCGPWARLLAIFVRNEADDNGIFEWKPLQLKMRIFPADAVDVAALLAELEETGQVAHYEVDGKRYGIIRNFAKYQRPRRPHYLHPPPSETQVPASFLIVPDEGGNDGRSDDDAPANVGNPSAEEEKEGEKSREGEKKTRAAGRGGDLAFVGKLIRLNAADLEQWRTTYSAIPDITAELATLDAYYDKNLRGAERSNWFVRCSSALGKKHQEWLAKARDRPKARVGAMHPGAGG